MDKFYRAAGRRQVRRRARDRACRPLWVALGDLMTQLALAHLEHGIRLGRPQMAYRAGRHLIRAVDYYARAGLGRKAAAVNRLIERSRKAWLRHEGVEGFA